MKEFIESQRFTQWWLWLILVGVALIPTWGMYSQVLMGTPMGNNPTPDWAVVFFCLFTYGMCFLFYFLQLKTTINAKGIHFGFFPLGVNRFHAWQNIDTAAVVHYGFVGGWGIRYGSKYGTVYNIRGAEGLAVVLKNGKKFLIGSQQIKTLTEVIQTFKKPDNISDA